MWVTKYRKNNLKLHSKFLLFKTSSMRKVAFGDNVKGCIKYITKV